LTYFVSIAQAEKKDQGFFARNLDNFLGSLLKTNNYTGWG
jgi:hypothetical protein